MFVTEKTEDGWILGRAKDMVRGNPKENLPFAFELTYEDFGRRYAFDKGAEKKWKRRVQDKVTVVRLYMGYPGTEYF